MVDHMALPVKRKKCSDEDITPWKKMKTKMRSEASLLDPIIMQIYSVNFKSGPPEMNLYKYIYRGMSYIYSEEKEIMSDMPEPDDSIIVVHHNEKEVDELFQCWIGFADVSSQRTTQTEHRKSGCVWPKLAICYLDEEFWTDKVSCTSVRDILRIYPQRYLLFIVNSEKSERKTFEIVKGLKYGIHARQIIRSRDVKKTVIEKCYEIQEECLAKFVSELETKARTRLNNKHLQTLKSLQDRIKRRKCTKKNISKACMKMLKKAVGNSILGYRLKDSVLQVLIANVPRRTEEIEACLRKIRETYEGEMREVLITPLFIETHCGISSGSELYRNSELMGTLGMFARLGDDKELVALSSGHVMQDKMDAFVKKNGQLVKFGSCIWPIINPSNSLTAHIPDVAVIILSKDVECFVKFTKLNEKVYLYDKPLTELGYGEVFKFGATTQKTSGYVIPDQPFNIAGTEVIAVEPDFGVEYFSLPGDSGAIVLSKIGGELYAVGVVFGGDLKMETSKEGSKESIVISLRHAIDRFHKNGKRGKILFDKF